jgi:hypothetical protein
VSVIVLSLAYPCLMFGFLQPTLHPEAAARAHFVDRYRDFIPEWMDSSSKGIRNLVQEVVANPLIALSLVFDPQRLAVFGRYWGGVAFLPLWNPMAWLALAPALENTLSSEGLLFNWGGANAFAPMMVTAVAMVISLAPLRKWRTTRGWITPLSWVMLFSSVLWWMADATTRAMGPPPWIRYATPMAPAGTAGILSTQIGVGKVVSAQSHLLPHLTHERQLYLFPPSNPVSVPGLSAEASEFERQQPAAGWPDLLIIDRESPSPQAWYNLWYYQRSRILEWLDWLVQSGCYRKTMEHGTLEIYERSGLQP